LPPQFGRDKNVVQAEKKIPTSRNYQRVKEKSDNKERVERVLLLHGIATPPKDVITTFFCGWHSNRE
jgi:hypothetical protein